MHHGARLLRPRMSRRSALFILAGAALLLARQRRGSAHAVLTGSDPPRHAVLTQPPAQIRLWFSERIEPDYSTISVFDADGRRVPTSRAAAATADDKTLILDLPPLVPGLYTVQYRANSIDGHIVESKYQFLLKAPAGSE